VDATQVIIQLGIGGFLALIMYKLGVLLIDKWAKADAERTKVTAAGFTAIVSKIDEHSEAEAARDAAVHAAIAGFEGLVNGLMNAAERLTPVDGTPILAVRPPSQMPPPPLTSTPIKGPNPPRKTPVYGVTAYSMHKKGAAGGDDK
jgi:hypothetical protein